MKIAVVGSRTFTDWRRMYFVLDRVLEKHPGMSIVSGGAGGADTWAREWALERGVECLEIRPSYLIYGPKAPLVRNKAIVASADAMVAFWDGRSSGTAHVMSLARAKGITVKVVRF